MFQCVSKVTMGLDFQPLADGLTAGLAGHCQPDKKYPQSQKEKGMICMSALREIISHPQLQCCQNKKRLFPIIIIISYTIMM